MRYLIATAGVALLSITSLADETKPNGAAAAGAGRIVSRSQGLHGYIGYSYEPFPKGSAYHYGISFYTAVWSLVDKPLANLKVGLPSIWILPDNSDNKDRPLAPEGTVARRLKERGPTWSSVFQSIEGGLGYWPGNQFHYGPPKFSINGIPQCYDYEVGSPGWSFFKSGAALPDDRLSIAQLSNRLLIPPDGLPLQGRPNGQFLGYSWMALPFTEPTPGDPPTGEQSWTCFLNAANFKGPTAYFIPESWSKIGKIFNDPFLHGRGLDARLGKVGGGAMELNMVPGFDATDAKGVRYSKIARLQFPVDDHGRSHLVQDVTVYSKETLYNAVKSWRTGGFSPSGQFDPKTAWRPKLTTKTTRYDQGGKKMSGIESVFDTAIHEGNVWGLTWKPNSISARGEVPQYYKEVDQELVAVAAKDVPAETGLREKEFPLARARVDYTSPATGAWAKPGPTSSPFTAVLLDGSEVTYSWYRFVDQPSFQQYQWSEQKKSQLQAFITKLHATWTMDRDYMSPPTRGALVALDPGLLVTPPRGMEVGYVPIVTRQAAKIPDLSRMVTPEMLAGRYQHEPVQNGWHAGELKIEDGGKGSRSFRWTNKAGASWKLTADLAHARLECDKDSPYFEQESGKSFRIEMQAAAGSAQPKVAGFQYHGTFYKRVGDR